MKKWVLILFLAACNCYSYAQITLWANNSGGINNDYGKGIYTDKQGNSYVTGTFDISTTIGPNNYTSKGSSDVFLMKVDKNGTILWSTTIGSNTADNCKAIYVGADNNVYIGGTFTNNTLYFSATDSLVHVAGNGVEAFYAKYSPAGVLLSKWRDGEFSKDFDINDILVTPAGEIVAGGKASQTSSADRLYLKRFNTSGTIIWSKTTSYGFVNGLAINSTGTNIYATGPYVTGFNPLGTALSIQGGSDIYYLTITLSSGTITDEDHYGSTGNDIGKDIELDGSNNILLACTYSGAMNVGTYVQPPYGTASLPAASADAVIIKFNASDGVFWLRRAAANSTDIARMRVDKYNNVFVHGKANNFAWSNNGLAVTGPYNVKLHRTYGDILWRTSVPNTTEANGIGIDSIGNVYSTGAFTATKNYGGISLTSAGFSDIAVYKQGSINIIQPALAKIKCANSEYGDTVGVVALPTYDLDPTNVYTVEMDTISTFVFSSPVTIGSLASSAAPALIICTIPAGTDPLTPGLRVKTSNPLNTGEDIWLDMREKPHITTTQNHILYKCINASAAINATTTEPEGAFTTTWNWSPMTSLSVSSGGNTSNGTTSANVPVTYTITATTSVGCKDTQVVQVLQYPAITINVGPDTTLCQGSTMLMNPVFNLPGAIASYQWTPVAAFNNANIPNALLNNPSAGLMNYNLAVYDTNGCFAQDGRDITRLTSPTINAGLPQYTTCTGSSFQLIATGTGISTYSWQPSAFVTNPTNDTVLVTPPATTTFTVTGTHTNGCFKTDTVQMLVGPIVVNASSDVTITCGNSTNITASTTGIYQTPLSYSWSPSTGLSSTTGSTVSAHPIVSTPYTVTLTTANGCTGTDVVNVNVNGASFPISFTATPQMFASPPFNVQFTNTTPGMAGYNFTWDFGDGITVANNNVNVFHTYTNNGTYDVTLIAVNTTTGCADTLVMGGYIFCSGMITCTLNAIVNTPEGLTTCSGDSLLLTCNTGVGYTYQWKLNGVNIAGANSSSYYATQSGNYTVEIIESVTCSDISNPVSLLIVPEPDFNLDFSGTPQLFTSPPFITQFTNNTPSMANYDFMWFWGDGQSTASNNVNVFHTYTLNGTYDVTLVATNINTGCQDTLFQGSYILCSGATTCTLTANVNSPNGLSACQGDSVLLSCNTGVGYTYQWKLNGSNISGAINSTYYAISSGNYSVEIVESGTCSAISTPVTVTIYPQPAPPVITQTGNLYSCGADTITLSATPGFSGYVWSTSELTQSINVITTGTYTVTISDAQGCTNTSTHTLSSVFYPAVPICVVGVDSLTSHNLIIWNNDSLAVIDSFIVYREGLILGQYERIGAQSSILTSTFLDGSSNPFQQAYRYKISQKDSCGNESALSSHHCTIHLTVNAGVGSTWNLLWNHYEGFSVPTYHIHRGTTPSNISFLTSISGSNNSYTDLTPPGGTVYYQIEIITSNCDPSQGRTNYNSSRSNVVDTDNSSIDNENGGNELVIMPNPSSGMVNLHLQNDQLGTGELTIEVLDQRGRAVHVKKVSLVNGSLNENLYLEDLAKGIYTVRIISGSFYVSQKLVLINH